MNLSKQSQSLSGPKAIAALSKAATVKPSDEKSEVEKEELVKPIEEKPEQEKKANEKPLKKIMQIRLDKS